MIVKEKAGGKKVKGADVGTLFRCEAKEQAKAVYVVGEFNGWNPTAHRMLKKDNGFFEKRIELAPGEYEYKFIVDGEWRVDPDAEQVPNVFGTTNSKVRV